MRIRGQSYLKSLRAMSLALVLGAVACTGDYRTEATTTTRPPVTLLPPPGQTAPPTSEPEVIVELSGTLAITLEHLVLVANPDGSSVDLVDGGPEGVASQPVWSPDGSSLAWVHEGPEGTSIGVQDGEGELSYSISEGAPPFYMAWNADGNRLAYLGPIPSTGQVELGLAEPGQPALPLLSGSSLYLSWAPVADKIAALVDAQELLLIAESGIDDLHGGGGGYTVPSWIDGSTLIVAYKDSIDRYLVNSGTRKVLVSTEGLARFTVSPDGEHIAYTDDDGGLNVFDAALGTEELVAEQGAVAWEWSPDSESLAFLAPMPTEEIESVSSTNVQRRSLVWSFWGLGDDPEEAEPGMAYAPSLVDVQSYLPFFEQFAQSHHRWSPDSNAFAFAGTIGGRSGIWIQAVDHADLPLFVTEGDSVTWGPGDPSSAGGSKL